MFRIVASITSLQQHLDLLISHPLTYKPRVCPHCGFGKLWCHGCYARKADRQPAVKSLNPIPIPRFLCFGCRRTCSRLPECIPPRRWYLWVKQQQVLLLLLTGCSLRQCAHRFGLDRRTIGRWWDWLKQRGHDFEFHLRSRFSVLGRAVDFQDFWQSCLTQLALSKVMCLLDHDGVRVP